LIFSICFSFSKLLSVLASVLELRAIIFASTTNKIKLKLTVWVAFLHLLVVKWNVECIRLRCGFHFCDRVVSVDWLLLQLFDHLKKTRNLIRVQILLNPGPKSVNFRTYFFWTARWFACYSFMYPRFSRINSRTPLSPRVSYCKLKIFSRSKGHSILNAWPVTVVSLFITADVS